MPRSSQAAGSRAILLTVVLALLPAASADAAPPANDAFAAAQVVNVDTTVAGTTAEATGENGEPRFSGRVRSGCTSPTAPDPSCQTSVWYALTATEDGPVNLAISCGHRLEVYTGHALATLGGVDQTEGQDCAEPAREATFDALKGLTYWIGVAGTGDAGAEPTFSLRIAQAPDTFVETTNGSRQPSPAKFALHSKNVGVSFECAIDGGAFSACSSTPSLPLADGAHTVAARALLGGRVDPTSARYDVTVDSVAPPLTLVSAQPAEGAMSNGANPARFTTSTTASDLSSVECSVDGAPFARCTFGAPEADIDAQCNASHTVRLRGVDTAHNAGAPTATSHFTANGWATDCAAPVITSTNLQGGYKTATLTAYVQTNGYGTDVTMSVSGHGTSDTGLLPASSQSVPVGLGLDDLTPSTTYTLTVTATSPGGTVSHSYPFTTAASIPGSATQSVSDITDHEATLQGTIDPGPSGYADWYFLLGPTAVHGRGVPFESDFPQTFGQPRSFSYRVGGLPAASPVHYQLTNRRTTPSELEVADLPDATFTTQPEAPAPPAATAPTQTPAPQTAPAAAPSTPASQPAAHHAPATKTPKIADVLALPSNKACRSRRTLTLHLRPPAGTSIVRAVVRVSGHNAKVIKGKALKAGIDLRGLPKGRYQVSVSVTLADGAAQVDKRAYRTCAKRKTTRAR